MEPALECSLPLTLKSANASVERPLANTEKPGTADMGSKNLVHLIFELQMEVLAEKEWRTL